MATATSDESDICMRAHTWTEHTTCDKEKLKIKWVIAYEQYKMSIVGAGTA